MSFIGRLQGVQARIRGACERSGRNLEEVGIIAVTKYVSLQRVMEVLEAGHAELGENRWQDAESKWRAVDSSPYAGQAAWHFIGSLQTNKVKEVVGRFASIHSLDRPSLAEAIHKRAMQLKIRVPCFIQVNISGEQSKHGISADELLGFAEQTARLDGIEISGLMTMAPYEAEPEETRPVFRGLRELRDRLNASGVVPYEVKGLSMGMSNDFEVAVEEGATWLRLGSVLVGKEEG